jgi:hypothetical protein
MHRWPDPQGAPSTKRLHIHHHLGVDLLLRVRALVRRRCRSHPPRSRPHLVSRLVTIAGGPQTPLKKVFPLPRSERILVFLHRGRRGRLSPRHLDWFRSAYSINPGLHLSMHSRIKPHVQYDHRCGSGRQVEPRTLNDDDDACANKLIQLIRACNDSVDDAHIIQLALQTRNLVNKSRTSIRFIFIFKLRQDNNSNSSSTCNGEQVPNVYHRKH